MLNILIIIVIFNLIIISIKFISNNKYSILNKRKLEENIILSSEITVTLDINGVYINSNYIPQPYIEYGESNTVIMKWNKTIVDCSYMFYNTSIIMVNLSNFDTSEVTSMEYMFMNSYLNNFTLKNNNFSKLKSMKGIFNNCNLLKNITFENLDFIELTSLNEIFNIPKIEKIGFININFPKLISLGKVFSNIITLQNIQFIK